MVLGIFGSGREESVAELVARKRYGRALEVLREQLDRNRRDERLRQQLADVLAMAGKPKEAVDVLKSLADEFALGGYTAKAIAVLKRIQRLEPGLSEVEDKLADMVKERDRQIIGTGERLSGIFSLVVSDATEEIGIDFEDLQLPVATVEEAPSHEAPPAAGGDAVESSPLFRGFGRDALAEVIRGLELQSFEPGDIVVSEGEPGDSLYVIAMGTAKAFVRDSSGRMTMVRRMEEGQFFGEISILEGKPRTATVTAATSCDLLELDRATLDRISQKHPQVRDVLVEFRNQRVG